VSRWSVVTPLRVDTEWWEETLRPLRRLEAAATSGRPATEPAETRLTNASPGFKEGSKPAAGLPDANGGSDSPSVKTLESGLTTLDAGCVGSSGTGLSSPNGVNGSRSGVVASSSNAKLGGKKAAKIAVHDDRLKGLFTLPDDDRAAKEDVEMETRTLTEPLPTNQQAYKSHHLYVLERWLTKYQVLHPKGPILGYCAGQPVYPRTSVQVTISGFR
jgi:hypothetical protein